jgi:hypothetical protein
MTTEPPICRDCIHWYNWEAANIGKPRGDGRRCDAFPAGIPDAILENEVDHTKPLKGDHGMQYRKATQAEIDAITAAFRKTA